MAAAVYARTDSGKHRDAPPNSYLTSKQSALSALQHVRVSVGEVRKAHAKEEIKVDQFLYQLDQQSIQVNAATYASLIRECGNAKALSEGKLVHGSISRSRLRQNRFLQNLLVQMYGKCRSLEEARTVFNSISQRNLFSWAIMIAAYAQNGHYSEALELYREMEGVKPDTVVFVNILSACSAIGSLADGKAIHAGIIANGFEGETVVATGLINMYGKCGSVDSARRVFDEMPRRDVVAWNAMIAAYAHSGHMLEALDLYRRMRGVEPDRITFASVVDACSNGGFLTEGKEVHADVIGRGLETDATVGNALINMYAKCHCLDEAKAVFDKLHPKSLVSWNCMIAAYAQNGHLEEALELFTKLRIQGMNPDKRTFLSILDGCCRNEDLAVGKTIHDLVAASSGDLEIVVGNKLVSMYGKCGSLDGARNVFDKMCQRDVVTWTTIISACASNGHLEESLSLYMKMLQAGVLPDKITFLSLLDACSRMRALAEGKMIHAHITAAGFLVDDVLGGHLVNVYSRCGSLEIAKSVFDRGSQDDVLLWNAMIAGYAQNGHSIEALDLYQEMQRQGKKPDRRTFLHVLGACSSLAEGRTIHSHIIASGLDVDEDNVLGTALVTMYGKCGSLDDSRTVFHKLRQKDKVAWTSMISAYAQNGHAREALEIYGRMDEEGVGPDSVTFASILEACAELGAIEDGKEIHARIIAGKLELDVGLSNALVNMYSKCGRVDEARSIFDSMSARNVVSWNTMIAAYTRNGHYREAIDLYRMMDDENLKPEAITVVCVCSSVSNLRESKEIHSSAIVYGLESDVHVGTALINMYGRCGNVHNARRVFDRMLHRDVVCWSAMVGAHAQNGHPVQALALFQQMVLEGFKADDISFVNILFACSHSGVLEAGWLYFVSMQGDHEVTPLAEHYACMIDLLGRAGWFEEAEELLENMPVKPDRAAWMSLAVHSKMYRGASLARQMLELGPECAAPYVLLSNICVGTESLEFPRFKTPKSLSLRRSSSMLCSTRSLTRPSFGSTGCLYKTSFPALQCW